MTDTNKKPGEAVLKPKKKKHIVFGLDSILQHIATELTKRDSKNLAMAVEDFREQLGKKVTAHNHHGFLRWNDGKRVYPESIMLLGKWYRTNDSLRPYIRASKYDYDIFVVDVAFGNILKTNHTENLHTNEILALGIKELNPEEFIQFETNLITDRENTEKSYEKILQRSY